MKEVGSLEAKCLLKIVKCFLTEREFELDEEIDEVNLYRLAKKHGLSHFLIDWARKSCKSQEIKNKIEQDYTNQIVKDTNENIEFKKILDAFEKNDIQTLVFKGFLMKAVYPQDYMRQMCDIDLLVFPKDFRKACCLLKDLGYEKHHNHEKHLVFIKHPFTTVEIHRKLVTEADLGHTYFNKEIWNFCIPYKNYKNIYQMTIEDNYIFCLVHLMLHFNSSGITVRHILDFYLYDKAFQKDFNYDKIKQKLEEFGIVKFEQEIRKIAYKWFGDQPYYDFNEVEAFILRGMSQENSILLSIDNRGSKVSCLVHMLFPKFYVMRTQYPMLEKAPVLLPFAWLIRLAYPKGSSYKKRLNKVKLIQEAKNDDVNKVKEIYENLGIVRKED